jgi:hypothetical protein
MGDNAFVDIADFEKVQEISNRFDVSILHHLLDNFAQTFSKEKWVIVTISVRKEFV